MDYKRNIKYFKGHRIWIAILLILFSLFAFPYEGGSSSFVGGYNPLAWLSIGTLLTGIVWIAISINITPKDYEIDLVAEMIIESNQGETLKKLKETYNISGNKNIFSTMDFRQEEIKPMRFLTRVGKDNKFRSSVINEYAVYFTDDLVLILENNTSLVQPGKITKRHEIYYDSITQIQIDYAKVERFSERGIYLDDGETFQTFKKILYIKTKDKEGKRFAFQNNKATEMKLEDLNQKIQRYKTKHN